MKGYIYETTNLVNGKKYIGKHQATEFEGNKYLGSGMVLKSAINKYGKENFEVEMLESCNSVRKINNREKYWIEERDAVNSDSYYNIANGGQGKPTNDSETIINSIINFIRGK